MRVFPSGLALKNWLATQETQEMWVWSLGQEDLLEEEMAAHSSILVWRIPRTEKPGGLLCIVLQIIRQDWSNWALTLDEDQVHKKNNYTGSEWLFRALRLNLIFNVFNLPFLHIWGKILQVKALSLIFSKIIWYFRQSSKLSNAAVTFLLFSHSDSFLTIVPSELFSPYINIYVNHGFGNYKSATFLCMEYQS